MTPLNHVSTLQGTHSHYGFSTGNTLPITAMPFGMVHWSPQTTEGSWFFDPRARKLQGIRATHQPSPWIGDYGWFVISAQTGEAILSPSRRSFAYDPDHSEFKPNVFRTESIRDRTTIEVVPTERGAIFRFRFFEPTARIIVQAGDGESSIKVSNDRTRIEGVSRVSSGGTLEGFGCYFVGVVDRAGHAALTFEGTEISSGASERSGRAVGATLEFSSNGQAHEILFRVATSFISLEQAYANLEVELSSNSFEALEVESTRVWNEALGKIEVESDSQDELATFYSCLYRTMLFPRTFHEPKTGGGIHHYSPFSGQVHDGPLVSDNGFWDTYRTVYPLLALISPTKLGEILSGWVNSYREGGWFPQWVSPGYRACMVGTHIDAVFADAVVKGIKGFDVETAYEGMRKHAFEVGDEHGAYGRLGIASYLEKGYVPDEEHEGATARTLDYAYNDFCLSQIALALGKQEDAALFRGRALNYRHLYDPSVGFMRGKTAGGEWSEPWTEFRWGGGYVEGGAWQSTWAVQHDPQGLINLMGGEQPFLDKLSQLTQLDPKFEVGSYGFEIHEMTEMACADFGQYAHSNQPVHHALYLFAAAGRPDLTQRWTREVMSRLYTPQYLPGDEDNGEMCAWYILNALGIYPLCPGHPSYVFGSPLFRKATVKREGAPDLVVEADGPGVYVKGITLDGLEFRGLSISHALLNQTTSLRFAMSDSMVDREVRPEDLPFSLSNESV